MLRDMDESKYIALIEHIVEKTIRDNFFSDANTEYIKKIIWELYPPENIQ
jgi:hypothetical protein